MSEKDEIRRVSRVPGVTAYFVVNMPENEVGYDHDHNDAAKDGANQDGNPFGLLISRTL